MASPTSSYRGDHQDISQSPAYSLQADMETKPSLLQRLKNSLIVETLLKIKHTKQLNIKKNKPNKRHGPDSHATAGANANNMVGSVPPQIPSFQNLQATLDIPTSKQGQGQEPQNPAPEPNPRFLSVMGFIPISTPPPAATCAQRRIVDSFFAARSTDSLALNGAPTAHSSGFGTPLARGSAVPAHPDGFHIQHFATSAGSPGMSAKTTTELLDGAAMKLENLVDTEPRILKKLLMAEWESSPSSRS